MVLYSGSVLSTIDASASSNSLTIELLELVGNVEFVISWAVADIIDAVDVVATRTNFTTTT